MKAQSSLALLEVERLKVFFKMPGVASQPQWRQALGGDEGIAFSIPAQSTVALVGESGSGKSLTAMSLLNLLPANALREGHISFAGQDLMQLSAKAVQGIRGKQIACVFQDPMSSLNPVLSIGQQLCEPFRVHEGLSQRQAWHAAQALLDLVQIKDAQQVLKRYPHQLSGGQQQRVMIAMAMALRPQLLIADEPTTALDVTVQKQILHLLADLKKQYQMSMLFISHDLGVVASIADQVLVLRDGQVCESGSTTQVMQSPQASYTQALLACRNSLRQADKRLQTVSSYTQAAAEQVATVLDIPEKAADKPWAQALTTQQQSNALLQVQNLSQCYWTKKSFWQQKRHYALGGQTPLQGISFELHMGRTLGVVGESGSGKSTLALSLLRLHSRNVPPLVGRVLFKCQDVAQLSAAALFEWRKNIQVVFQNPYASLNPRMSIQQILLEPMHIHGLPKLGVGPLALGQVGLPPSRPITVEEVLIECLAKVGLEPAALSKYPHEFSGGQRQRIAIARCLILQPQVLILDEPVSALDLSVQAQVLNLLKDLQAEFGLAYLFISHDLRVVRYMADEVLVMQQGQVVEQGLAAQVWQQPEHAYTQQLLASMID